MSTQSNAQGLSRAALISLVVFAVLVAATLVDVSANRTVRVGIRELPLPTMDKDKVTKVEIGGKFKAILEKDGGSWKVADPEKADAKFAADEESVSRMLDALSTLETGAFVTGRAEKHEELEINDEKGTKLTVQEEGGKTLAVVLGRYAKGGGNYVRLQDSDEVFVGKGTLAGNLRKSASQWRNKKMVSLKAEDVVEVAISPAGQTPYVLVSKTVTVGEGDAATEKTEWALQDESILPPGFKLDRDALSRVARSVASLRASDFVDEQKPAAETGLGAASTITAKDKAGTQVTVKLGAEKDRKVYAQVEGNPQLFMVSQYSADNLRKAATDFRDLSLLSVKPDQVVAVDWAGKGLSASLKKDDAGAWTFTSNPPGAQFDPSTVSGKLAGLGRLKGARYLGQEGAVKVNLSDKLTIAVKLASGSSKTVTFGGPAPEGPDGKNKNQVFALPGDGHVYAIAKFQKERYKKPADLFKPVAPPPGAMGGGGGGIPGMENLPPEIRKKLEEQMRQGNFPQ